MRRTACLLAFLLAADARAAIVVAEGEHFEIKDDKGWKQTHQQDSFGSHTYGGMWMSQGGCLAAPASSAGSVAIHPIQIKEAGKYRVWSKYQAPPYFNFHHKVEIIQGGKTVFEHVYGKKGTDRLWSFSGVSNELWWPWGIDHDTAEGAKALAELAAGPAEIRLTSLAGDKPAGDRCVDFILLTTKTEDSYEGFKPFQVGSPFTLEALAQTRLYCRFKNTGDKPAQLTVSRSGHFQPNYGGATIKYPEKPIAAGEWSPWVHLGAFCRLVHDEGLTLSLGAGKEFPVQFARGADGSQPVGEITATDGDTAVVPIDIAWRNGSVVKTAKQHATEILAEAKTWRRANGGKKPKEIAFYGAFSGKEDWVNDLKHTLGYNTILPEKYEQLHRDGLFAHAGDPATIKRVAAGLKEKDRLRVLSFGDEISLGKIDYKNARNNEKFRDWLKAKKLTKADLGVEPSAATLTDAGNNRLVWYSNLFNEEERFASYRELTELAKKEIGPNVLTGANYSPHHLALYYGPIFQWVDIFKHGGMSMMWAEDYVFSVPELPQIISWQFAQMRCGVKYHNQPIHFYVMPHAPGQEPAFLRRNMLFSVGAGAKHIDSFWVGPAERFTENYVSWGYREQFKTLGEAIFDTAEAETILVGGKVRPARVALVTGKATDFNETRLMVDKAKDPFAKDCKNAPAQLNQIICRKDQQMLYLALVQAGHAVELITEDDIAELDILKNFDTVHFVGEWVDRRAVAKLDAWVKAGGVLYACAGCGHKNEFDEAESGMLDLLGVKEAKFDKNVAIIRTLLELPLMPAIDTIEFDGKKIPAIGMRQAFTTTTAKVLGKWADGTAAVTVREHGKGKAFAVGTLAGNTYMKPALRQIPFARGGKHTVYNPTDFDTAASKLARLAIEDRKPERVVECSVANIEAIVMDHPKGTLVTLVNWNNEPIKDVEFRIRLPFEPKSIRTVEGQKAIAGTSEKGILKVKLDLKEADFLMLMK